YLVESVVFDDGTTWTLDDLMARLVQAGSAAGDALQGLNSYANRLNGLEGNDTLNGGAQADVLEGGAGDDTLNGNAGEDTLIGGTGNDALNGGSGNDAYVFNLGDGADSITDHDTSVGNLDTLRLGAGLTVANTEVIRSGSDVVLRWMGNDSDSVTIKSLFYDALIQTGYLVESVVFDDGTTWTLDDLMARLVQDGSTGNDLLTGLNDHANRLKGLGGNDTLYGGVQADVLEGGAGDDTLYGSAGADTLIGGAGSDSLNGGTGNDIYIFNLGDGADRITDLDADAGNHDTLRLGAGLAPAHTEVVRSGGDLVLRWVGNTSDSVTIKSVFQGASVMPSYLIESIVFDDGTIWTMDHLIERLIQDGSSGNDGLTGLSSYANWLRGLEGNDTLTGGSQADILEGGAGNDTLNGNDGADLLIGGTGNDALNGGAGNDIYVFNLGDGADTITDSDVIVGNHDTLRLGAGLTAANTEVVRSGGDLVLSWTGNQTDSVKIKNVISGSQVQQSSLIESVVFNDGTVWALDDLMTRLVQDGSAGNDTLTGLSAYANNLRGLEGNDRLHGGSQADVLEGGAGDDTLNGNDGADLLIGGTGNDTLNGGAGNDIYVFNLGDGADTITDSDSASANHDTLRLGAGLTPTNTEVVNIGNDLVLRWVGNATDSVTIKSVLYFGWFVMANFQIEQVIFDDGTTWSAQQLLDIQANGGRYVPVNYAPAVAQLLVDQTVLEGTALTYTLPTGAFTDANASDILTYSATLSDGSSLPAWLSFDTATRTLSGTPPTGADADLSVRITATDPAGASASSVFTLHIEPDYTSPVLSDATHTLSDGYLSLVLTGTATINGTGNAEANHLTGNSAANVLAGGAGDDIYHYHLGGGSDTLIELDGQGHDTLRLGAGISPTPTGTRPSREGTDLILNFGGAGHDQVRVSGYFDAERGTVETIAFANGKTWDFDDVVHWMVTAETPPTQIRYVLRRAGGDELDLAHPVIGLGDSSAPALHVVTGSSGDDTLHVGAGMRVDARVMGSGADTIYLTGKLSDYFQAIDQDTGVYTFAHKTRLGEVLQLTSVGDDDVLYFQDGHIVFNALSDARLYDESTGAFKAIEASFLVPQGTPANTPDATLAIQGIDTTTTTLSATLSRPLATVLTDAQAHSPVATGLPIQVNIKGMLGQDLAPLRSSGQAMNVVMGGAGDDSVYVTPGTGIDARVLGSGNDRIRFTGQLNDYTQTIEQDTGVYTFTHKTRPTEVVRLTSVGEDDELWFADGHIVFNANADTRLYNEATGAFMAVQANWLSAGGTPILTERLEYSIDGGETWQDATSAVSGTTVTLTDPALTSGSTIQLRVSSQAASGAAAASQVTGAGEDVITLGTAERAALANSRYDGGAGTDTLALRSDQSGVLLDFTAYGQHTFTGIERIDLTGGGNNTAKLTIDQLLNMPDEDEDRLIVLGDAGDAVQLVGGSGSWSGAGTQQHQGLDYAVYTHSGAAGRELFVQQGVVVM
ncbi:calcium-binding protein, partial [Hydrogenophaga sp.]|uniref:calcium-binding protein n=1 Tax=Hydrogenophaga sp. TaxID=1904254 RepID=UPI003F70E029